MAAFFDEVDFLDRKEVDDLIVVVAAVLVGSCSSKHSMKRDKAWRGVFDVSVVAEEETSVVVW